MYEIQRQNYTDKEQNTSVIARCWGWGDRLTIKYKGYFGGGRAIRDLDCGSGDMVYIFVKTQRNCTLLKRVIFTVYQLSLSTRWKKKNFPMYLHFLNDNII